MEARVIWKEGFAFDGRSQGFSVPMDATPPLGHHFGPNPKELFLMSIGGCAAMDVVGLLKKHHEFIDRFDVAVSAEAFSKDYPRVFHKIEIVFHVEGAVDPLFVSKAIERSQSLYSGVSAMVCQSVPIHWKAIVNGLDAGFGYASYKQPPEEFRRSSYEG